MPQPIEVIQADNQEANKKSLIKEVEAKQAPKEEVYEDRLIEPVQGIQEPTYMDVPQ